ncbi:MAG: tetratricopeptide repeat protein [Phycisphaerae bacterium]|nr:tetratricopeptide repeat protein [Phycisphaerae bacterium]
MSLKKVELTGRNVFWVSCIIFLFALFVRLLYLYESSDSPIFRAPIVDARGYDYIARIFVDKGKMQDLFFWQQFFYPFFLSVVYFFSSCSIVAAKVVQAILGSLTCVLAFLLGRKIFNWRTGLVACLLTVFYGPLIFHESDLISAGWEALWAVALVWLFLKVADKQNIPMYLLLGICGALSALVRPNFLLFFLAACGWLGVITYRSKKQLSFVGIALAAILITFILVMLPVGIQNYRVTGHFGVLPASGGINLYIGNNPDFDAAAVRPGPKWEEVTNMPRKYGISNNMWDKQRFFYARTCDYIVSQPISFLKGLAGKAMQVISSREMPGNVDVYLFRKFSVLLSVLMWEKGPFGFPFGLLLPLSFVGLIYSWRQVPMPAKLFLVIYPLPLIMTHIESRYRVAMVPILSILAAAGIEAFISLIKGYRWSRLIVAVMLIVLAVLASTLPGPFPSEKLDYLPELYNSVGITLGDQGKIGQAIENYKRAIQFAPEYFEAYYNLAATYYKLGDINQAVINYEKSLQLDPNSYKGHYNLGVALYSVGNFELAKTRYMETLRLKPDYTLAYKALAIDSVRKGQPDQAIAYYKKVLEIDSGDVEAHYQLGMLLVRRNDIDSAIQEFEQVLQLDPNHSDAKQALLILQRSRNK